MNVLSVSALVGTLFCAFYSPNAGATARAFDANGNTVRTAHMHPTQINCPYVGRLPPRCRKHAAGFREIPRLTVIYNKNRPSEFNTSSTSESTASMVVSGFLVQRTLSALQAGGSMRALLFRSSANSLTGPDWRKKSSDR